MNNIKAKNFEEVEKYRQRIFKEKERRKKRQAKLPFEEKMKILMKLRKFSKEFRNSTQDEMKK